jgi:hypothetical protein
MTTIRTLVKRAKKIGHDNGHDMGPFHNENDTDWDEHHPGQSIRSAVCFAAGCAAEITVQEVDQSITGEGVTNRCTGRHFVTESVKLLAKPEPVQGQAVSDEELLDEMAATLRSKGYAVARIADPLLLLSAVKGEMQEDGLLHLSALADETASTLEDMRIGWMLDHAPSPAEAEYANGLTARFATFISQLQEWIKKG